MAGRHFIWALSAALLGCASPRAGSPESDGMAPPGADGSVWDAGPGEPGAAPTDGRPPADSGSDGSPGPAPEGPPRRLAITLSGPGELYVDDRPLSCPGTCTVERPAGTAVAITARPQQLDGRPVSLFLGWAGACTGKGGCTLTLSADTTLTATFHRFVLWEHASAGVALSVVEGELYASTGFVDRTTLAGQSFTSTGNSDGLIAHLDQDGRLVWARLLVGPGYDTPGPVLPGPAAGQLRVQAWVGEGATFQGQALPLERPILTLSRGGDLVSAGASRYTLDAPSEWGGGFMTYVSAGDNQPLMLARIDAAGQVVWSKPDPSPNTRFGNGRVCDRSGSAIATLSVGEPVTVAGTTYSAPATGVTRLLVGLSPAGDLLWATPISAELLAVDYFCDGAGDIYLSLRFIGDLRVGGRTTSTQGYQYDVAIAKLRGTTRELLWLTAFGNNVVDDLPGPMVLDSAGKVLVLPTFLAPVTLAGETLPAGTPIVRLDPASGAVLATFLPGRELRRLLPRASGRAYFSGAGAFGLLELPP